LARVEGDRLELSGVVISPDGTRSVRGRLSGALDSASTIGPELAETLGKQGGYEIVERATAAGAAR